MGALDPNSLKKSQKKVSLRQIKLIKEKRIIKLKDKTYTDGQTQRCCITKEDEPSLTISLEALFDILIINAHEGKDVVFFMSLGHTSTLTKPEDTFIL